MKADVANTAAPVTSEHQTLAAELLQQIGGKDNIESVLVCATSRVRLELRTDTKLNEHALRAAGVTQVMRINERIVHLLMGDDAEGAEQALTALL